MEEYDILKAEAMLDFYKNLREQMVGINLFGDGVPIKKNETIKLIINLIKASENENDTKVFDEELLSLSDPKKNARIIYDLLIITAYMDEACMYIAKKVGFDYEKESDMLKLTHYMRKTRRLIEEFDEQKIHNISNYEETEFIKKEFEELHKICEEAKKCANFYKDLHSLMDGIDSFSDGVPFEENEAIKLIIKLIKTSENENDTKEFDEELLSLSDPKKNARITYDFFFMTIYMDEARKYIANEVGFDYEKEFDMLKLTYYIRETKRLIREFNGHRVYDVSNDEVTEFVKKTIEELCKNCADAIKDKKRKNI